MTDLSDEMAVARETAADLRDAARVRRLAVARVKDSPRKATETATLRSRAARDTRRAAAIEALIAHAEATQ